MSATTDYAHTRTAETNRARKADALAATARRLGYMPWELRVIGGGVEEVAHRDDVRREAGIASASVETWQAAITRLTTLAAEACGPVPALCPRCTFPVRWVNTEGGQRIALDPFPHPFGSVRPPDPDDPAPRPGMPGGLAHVNAGGEPRPDDVALYRQHVTSCPSGRRPGGPRCTACHQPMNAIVAAAEPHVTHPSCDTTYPESTR